MSQVTADVAPALSSTLTYLYEPIRDELAAAEALLAEELQSRYPFVDKLVRHGFRLGGKRLRPALLLLAAKAAGAVRREHLVLSAVVEMIHTATLVHDDVLDEADQRRHLPTVNALWTNEASVLLGDYLFTHAFYLASTLGTAAACQMIGRATNTVCEGELRQVHSRGDFSLTEADYLSIIESKTASLCACCCELGAHFAQAPAKTQEALAQFGRNLGIAFQIADDVLDLTGDEAQTGKSLGTDLEKQKLTLPLIHFLGQLEPERRQQVTTRLRDPDGTIHDELRLWLRESESLGYAQAQAARHARQAAKELQVLESSPAQQRLLELTQFVVARQH